jgi:hypothetical protein
MSFVIQNHHISNDQEKLIKVLFPVLPHICDRRLSSFMEQHVATD